MARVPGTFNISSNYNVSVKKPFDARMLVPTYADLTLKSNWQIVETTSSGTTKTSFIAYNGMLVAVADKNNVANSGLYMLFDVNSGKNPDVENIENWIKIGETSEISELVSRLSSIETGLASIEMRLATLEKDKAVIRRDNEYNFKNTTPKANEICIVDVAGKGVRVKIGDGKSTFAELHYIDDYVLNSVDNIIIKGYLYKDNFYSDTAHTELLEARVGRIYIDTISSKLYTYNGIAYEAYKTSLPNATAEVAGVVKLYNTVGQNVDGTMTQKAITDELDEKVEMQVIKDAEMLIFDTDLF